MKMGCNQFDSPPVKNLPPPVMPNCKCSLVEYDEATADWGIVTHAIMMGVVISLDEQGKDG